MFWLILNNFEWLFKIVNHFSKIRKRNIYAYIFEFLTIIMHNCIQCLVVNMMLLYYTTQVYAGAVGAYSCLYYDICWILFYCKLKALDVILKLYLWNAADKQLIRTSLNLLKSDLELHSHLIRVWLRAEILKGFAEPLATSHAKENISIRHLTEKSWKRVKKAMLTFWQIVKKWTTLFSNSEFFEWTWNLMRWHQNWCSVKSVGKRNFFKNCWIVSLRKTWLKKNAFWEISSSWLVKVTIQFGNAKLRSMNSFTVQRNMMSTHAILMTQKRSK